MSDSDSEYDIFYNDLVIDDEVLSILDRAESAHPPSSSPASSDVGSNEEVDDLKSEPKEGHVPPASSVVRSCVPLQDSKDDFEDEYDCFPELLLTQEDNAHLASLEQQFFQSQASFASNPRNDSPVSLMVSEIAGRSQAPERDPSSPVLHEAFLGSKRALPIPPPPRSRKRRPLRALNRSSSPIVISSDDEVGNVLKSEVSSRERDALSTTEPKCDVVVHDLSLWAGPVRSYTRYIPDDVIELTSDEDDEEELSQPQTRRTVVRAENTEPPVKRRKLNPPGQSSASSLVTPGSDVDNSQKAFNDTETMKLRPLDRFFSRFLTFDYCRSAPVNAEFARLRDHECWKPRGDKSKEMYGEFRNALISEFNATYGMDANSIKSWQYLCTLLRIDPIPCCLEECRGIVLSTHVNLVDLLDTHRTGQQVTIFETEEELKQYTITTGKFFPLERARQGGVLQYLLRHILR